MESTGNALAIARILDGHVAEVALANPMQVRAISHAKVKSDRFDARTLAELFQAGVLPTVWVEDERTRCLRRLTSRRSQLVRQRTRVKNEITAVLVRNLAGRPPASDLFGKRGRAWLQTLELPGDERQTVDACLRQVDFLTEEIGAIDGHVAAAALDSAEIKRLMTIPCGHHDRRDADGRDRRHPSIPKRPAPRRISRARRARAPVGEHPGASRTDLQAGLLSRTPRPGGGRVGCDQGTRAAARVLSARQSSPGIADRDRRRRSQDRCAQLAAPHQARGLRVQASVARR